MNFIDVLIFLQSYSLPTVLIALTVSVIFFVLDKVLKDKIPKAISTFIPPLSCVILYLVYDLIFVTKGFSFNAESLSASVICASVCLVLSAIFSSFTKNGNLTFATNLSPETLAVATVIKRYVNEDKEYMVAEKIVKLLNEGYLGEVKKTDSVMLNEVTLILAEETDKNNSYAELLTLSTTALASYKAIKNL